MENTKPISNRLFVTIQSPDQTYFEGEADAITSLNEKGTFDVLPLHANFISLINQTIVIYQNNTRVKEIHINSGVLKVTQNKVEIYLGIQTTDNLPKPPTT